MNENPDFWTTDRLFASLLESVKGQPPYLHEIPAALSLDGFLRDQLDPLYNSSHEHLRFLKTDATKERVIIQSDFITGAEESVRFRPVDFLNKGEIPLGVLHNHKDETNFSNKDIVGILLPRWHILGLVNPYYYYLTFRIKDQVTFDSYDAAVEYLLKIAQKNNIPIDRSTEKDEGFMMTSTIFQTVKLPLYIGKRGQNILHLVNN